MTPARFVQISQGLQEPIESSPSRVSALVMQARESSTLAIMAGPLPVLVVGAIIAVAEATGRAWIPLDALLYWQASGRLDNLYASGWTSGYNYAGPPPVAQLWALLHALPLELALAAWITFLFGCLWYSARAWALPIIGLGLIGIATDIPGISAPLGIVVLGNVGMLMTAGLVASIRYSGAIAIPVLAKVGPGAALFWHLFRGDRRAVIIGLIVTAIAAATSFMLDPGAWFEWVAWIGRNYGSSPVLELSVPFVVRVPVGLAVIAVAARTDRPWLVPIGAGLCIPADYGSGFLTIWVGALGLRGIRRPAPVADPGVPMGGGVRD
jgi:hypothetical protein